MKYLFFGLLFSFSILLKGQESNKWIDYKVEINFNSLENKASIEAIITLPVGFTTPGDSIYIQLPAQAFVNKYSHFGRRANQLQQLEFYYRKDSEYAKISGLYVVYMGNSQPIDFLDFTEEYFRFAINTEKFIDENKQLKVAYDLRLPKLIYGLGYLDSCYQLNGIVPIVAGKKNGKWLISNYGTDDDTQPNLSNFEVVLTTDREVYPITMQGGVDGIPTSKMIYKETVKYSSPPIVFSLNKMNLGVWKIDRDLKPPMRITNFSPGITNETYFPKLLPKLAYAYENRLGEPVRIVAFSVSRGPLNVTHSNANYITNHNIVDLWFKEENAFNKKADWIEESLKTYYQNNVNTRFKQADNIRFISKHPTPNEYYIPSLTKIDSLKNIYGFGTSLVSNGSSLFENIADYVGAKSFDSVIKTYLASDEVFEWEVFATRIKEASGKDVSSLINNALYTKRFTDYQLLDMKVDNQVVELKVRNNKSESLPFGIFMYYGREKDTVIWREGFVDEKTIILTPNVDKELQWVELDYNRYLPEYNRYNNRIWANRANLRLVNPSSKNYTDQHNIRWSPTILYNDNDNAMFGLALNGSKDEITPFKFFVLPQYSTAGKKIVGEAWFSYRKYLDPSQGLKSLNYSAGIKSFSKFRNKREDYTERYMVIDPSITFNFRHDNLSTSSYLRLTSNIIVEQNSIFDNKGKYFGLSNQNYLIHQLQYTNKSCGYITSTQFSSKLEYQRYQPIEQAVQYLKLTTTYNFMQKYTQTHSYSLRFFASAFLLNDNRRSNNFQDVITRGSIAMAYQGFNDYIYDGYYFSRENQMGALNNQVNQNAGGGFKTPFGSSIGYGMSNNLAFATNLAADLPIRLPSGLHIKAFIDLGGFSQLDDKDKFKIKGMYNGGFSIDYKDKVAIYFPLIFDKNTKQNYYTIHDKYLNRISFSMNLSRLSNRFK